MLHNNKPLVINSKYIIFLTMLYMTVSLAADVVAFKFGYFFGLVESGATIIFPFTYILGDVMCEVYGWKLTIKIVWLALICEVIFSVLITLVIYMPSYGIGDYQDQYVNTLGKIWFFVLAGVVSNSIAGFINIYCMSKWKILMQGKYFWMRSILSTCISEFILILITILIAFLPFIKLDMTIKVFIDAYFLEIIYAFIFAFPANLLVNFLRKKEGIDAYDYGVSYNPFNLFENGEIDDNRNSRGNEGRSSIN